MQIVSGAPCELNYCLTGFADGEGTSFQFPSPPLLLDWAITLPKYCFWSFDQALKSRASWSQDSILSVVHLASPVAIVTVRELSHPDVTLERIVMRQQIQMLPRAVPVFWITLASIFAITCLFLPVEGQAQQHFDINPDHYVFGWFTTGLLEPGQLPICRYCVNVLGDGMLAVDTVNGPDWNRTVGLYRCDGAQNNEVWAYNSSINSIAYANFKHMLCLDAVLLDSNYVLKLRPCNVSVVTQQWKYENHNLVNGLVDPTSGLNYTLWAAPPDLGTNPSSGNYTYPLTIASFAPPGFSYTSNFSFLPIADFAQRFTDHFTTKGLLQISNSSLGQITNGDFENSTILAGSTIKPSAWNQTFPSYFGLCGWVIDYGPIDYVNTGYLTAAHGYRSIHLNTFTDVSHSGSISQTIRTEKDKEYVLSFFRNARPNRLDDLGRPPCSPSYLEAGARLQLRVTNATTTGLPSNRTDFTQNFTSNVTGLNADNLGELWKQETVIFTALTNLTKISFISLNVNESCGPMIDMVEVSLSESLKRERKDEVVLGVVAGTVAGLVGIIAILSIVSGVRYYRARVDYSGLYKTEHAKVYTVKELSNATKNFSSVLGEGGFGTVYKAEFLNGTVGAVKVEKPKGPNSSSKVLASEEIAVLLRVHHINLVNLTGFCIHKGRHMLVFEYLPNGSLYDRLHQSIPPVPPAKSSNSAEVNQVRTNVLPWKQRVKIASDVACGLEYLHYEANPPIVHRDIKSQNILLTTKDFAKLADFGLSKAAPVDATSFQSIETMVKGSIGYLDPQYLATGVFSPKSDVYSFGVVLLELISGHPAIHNANSLAFWAAEFMTSTSLYAHLVDERLDGDFNATELESLVELSTICMQADGKMRPNMRQVVAFLNGKQLPSLGGDTSECVEGTQLVAQSPEMFHKINQVLLSYESHSQDSSSGSWLPSS